MLRQIYQLSVRECKIFLRNPIFLSCMVVFPLLVMFFFTSMMGEGQPVDMPIGVVDMDNSSTTRALIRRLDAFETSHVVAHYTSVNEARHAIQNNEIYAFLYLPKGTTEQLLSNRQKTYLQPITIDLHQIGNPTTDYNAFLSTMLIPGVMMLFIFLITTYSIGTELKFNHGKQVMEMAGNHIWVMLFGKFLPHLLIWLTLVFGYSYYVFGVLGFPHTGGTGMIVLLNLLMVFAAMGFGVFAFGLMPSLRMSMSISSLWAVLSFSMAGTAFPVMGMDGPLQAMAWLFPLHHYFMVYETCVFNSFSLLDCWWHVAALLAFMLLPMMVAGKIKNAMLTYVYIP